MGKVPCSCEGRLMRGRSTPLAPARGMCTGVRGEEGVALENAKQPAKVQIAWPRARSCNGFRLQHSMCIPECILCVYLLRGMKLLRRRQGACIYLRLLIQTSLEHDPAWLSIHCWNGFQTRLCQQWEQMLGPMALCPILSVARCTKGWNLRDHVDVHGPGLKLIS